MNIKAKRPKVAAVLHTADYSHMHVLVPTVVRTPNVAAAEKPRLKNATFPPS